MLKVAPHISWTPVEGELALFDTRDGSYHALNASAAEIWRGLAAGTPPADLAARLAARYGAPEDEVVSGVASFVEDALARGLLVGD